MYAAGRETRRAKGVVVLRSYAMCTANETTFGLAIRS